MTQPAVEAVLLDVGGVVLLPERAAVLGRLARAGVRVHPDRLDRGHYEALAAIEQPTAYTVARASLGYATAYLRAIGVGEDRINAAEEELFRPDQSFRVGWLQVRDGAMDELRALVATGVRLAIVSNADGTIEEELRALGVCQAGPGPGVPVVAVIDSAVVGVAKPNPRIFELALAAVGTPPARTVHVGDTLTYDLAGARAAGIHPVHYDPFRICGGDGHDDVASLVDLIPLLGRGQDG